MSSERRKVPTSKPHQPPETRVTTRPQRQEPAAAAPVDVPEEPRPKRGLVYAALVLLVLMLGAVAALVAIRPSPAPSGGPAAASDPGTADKDTDKDAQAALQHLQELQRAWFEDEGLGQTGNKDPEAFSHLLATQQQWWEDEGLVKDGNADSAKPLARLEELQRSWWAKEGLAGGKKSDAGAALERLAEINRKWWLDERLARNSAADDGTKGVAPEGSDTKYRLLTEKSSTQKFLEAGGSEESEQAVQLGLSWLAAQQLADGRWETHAAEKGKRSNDIVATAFGLLPFLAHGETHRATEGHSNYSKRVDAGLKFLLGQMKSSGDLRGDASMYVHALATMALCQAYDVSADPLLKEPCQRAVNFLIRAQDNRGGGFRYQPGQPGDLSVSSWCLMALKSAQMAGLHIPSTTVEKATRFVESASRADGSFNYMPTKGVAGSVAMTAAGIVCRQYLNKRDNDTVDLRSPALTRGVDIILRNPPRDANHNYYYFYYATYALLPIGGDAWKSWNPRCRDLIVRLQDKGLRNPANKGSWDPAGRLQAAGRVGVTSLALLTLEVYYRHLPVNRPELGEMVKGNVAKK